jgi:hypothetical protein
MPRKHICAKGYPEKQKSSAIHMQKMHVCGRSSTKGVSYNENRQNKALWTYVGSRSAHYQGYHIKGNRQKRTISLHAIIIIIIRRMFLLSNSRRGIDSLTKKELLTKWKLG